MNTNNNKLLPSSKGVRDPLWTKEWWDKEREWTKNNLESIPYPRMIRITRNHPLFIFHRFIGWIGTFIAFGLVILVFAAIIKWSIEVLF